MRNSFKIRRVTYKDGNIFKIDVLRTLTRDGKKTYDFNVWGGGFRIPEWKTHKGASTNLMNIIREMRDRDRRMGMTITQNQKHDEYTVRYEVVFGNPHNDDVHIHWHIEQHNIAEYLAERELFCLLKGELI